MVGPDTTNSFSKTICSICYEDLKPIVEDLQSISICGHVFHELCLQQWFEYCTSSKKQTCPVCKQGCTHKNVGRLYFQSIGDPVLTQCDSENPRIINRNDGDCPEILRVEVKRLEAKVSNLSSALELQQNQVNQLTDELHKCKEQLSQEVILKNEACRQRETIKSVLEMKSSELVRSAAECSNLQAKNKGLVKELASLKLVSDCNLDEEEILKHASICHEGNMQDVIDVLKNSLATRNKSYKDLMAKCNSLGRGEARFRRKLEKAKEKKLILKKRVQELEIAIEAKDNEVLRRLKASKKRSSNDLLIDNSSTKIFSDLKPLSFGEKRQISSPVINLDDDGDSSPSKAKHTGKNDASVSEGHGDGRNIPYQEMTPYDFSLDEGHELQKSRAVGNTNALKGNENSHQNSGSCKPVDSGFKNYSLNHSYHHFESSSPTCLRNDIFKDSSVSKEDSGLLLHHIRQVQPSAHSKPEASSVIPLVEPGDRCFAGGLMGPDGANRYLGKWCKRVQNTAPKGSTNGSDGLIAVGADGRGGRVNVLRSFNQTSMDSRESIVSAKRLKPGGKSSNLQTQGCLQIEHFFGKARS